MEKGSFDGLNELVEEGTTHATYGDLYHNGKLVNSMQVSNHYIVVEKIEEEIKEGEFQTVQVQDSSVYKGKVVNVPEQPVYMGNKQVAIGDTVIFAKYSPDTHEVDDGGKKVKFIKTDDILAVL